MAILIWRAKANPGRQIAIHASCPWETVASTVNQQCVSSMKAAEMIYQEILLGKVEIGAAVGAASMSNVPLLPQPRVPAQDSG